MNDNEKKYTSRAILGAVIATLAATLVGVALAAWLLLGRGGLAMLQGAALVNRKFVGEYTQEEMSDSALRGMVAGLGDRWSYYLNAEEYEQQTKVRANRYVGIGITYEVTEDGGIAVMGVTPGGPAEEAGLEVGDTIVAIQGETLTDENRDSLLALLGRREGDRVEMAVRNAAGEERSVTVTVGPVNSDPVRYVMLEDHMGYVQLNNFYERSAQRLQEAVDDLAAQGAQGLIFDVRNNPGGYVQQLTTMLDYLLPEGPIFTERTKKGTVRTVRSKADCVDLPMVVLVNKDSYSAAEMFAAQLRESVGAGLVGQVTSGKGYYQQMTRLVNGGALNLSSGLYGTGSGASLIGVGLTPDIQEDDPGVQLERAVELLREEMEGR